MSIMPDRATRPAESHPSPVEISAALAELGAQKTGAGVWTGTLANGTTVRIVRPVGADVWRAASMAADWLDEHNGAGPAELAGRILKVTEEAGEVAAAWIGATGQNPRKGKTHTYADVAAELGDVVLSALVAIESLGLDPAEVMTTVATKVINRVGGSDDLG